MRTLILGHELDPTGSAVALAMAQRHGAESVCRASLQQLAEARWEHRISAQGTVGTRLDLGGSGGADWDIVFNRIGPIVALCFNGWSDADRSYGHTEWLALLLSWLHSLGGRVVNRPAFGSLNGPADRPWPWMVRAASAGLSPHPAGATTSTRRFPPMQDALEYPALLPPTIESGARADRAMGYAAAASALVDVLVVGEDVFGEAGTPSYEGCLRLARASGTDVLGVRLAQVANDPTWRFVAANPSPVIDGDKPLAALVALFERRGAGAP